MTLLTGELTVICNGCGEAMRSLGEWPIQYPKAEKPMNSHQAYRWTCKTCKIPHPTFASGVPVMAIILKGD